MTDHGAGWPPRFSLDELKCRCGCAVPPDIEENLRLLAWKLYTAFRAPLDEAVIVTSGYRCQAHNTAIGGATQSLHTTGMAADIKILGRHGRWLAGWAECQIANGNLTEGGIGIYDKHHELLHYDFRGVKARWHRRAF